MNIGVIVCGIPCGCLFVFLGMVLSGLAVFIKPKSPAQFDWCRRYTLILTFTGIVFLLLILLYAMQVIPW
jgi:hypothetical protein